MSQHFVIIGAGPAGEAAARKIRHLSQISGSSESVQISLIEKKEPGGLCLNRGCVPSKTLLEQLHHRNKNEPDVDWNHLQDLKNQVVSNIRTQLERSLKTQKINLIRGIGEFSGPNTIELKGQESPKSLLFDKAIVTTGTEIFYPPPLDQFRKDLLNSDKVLQLRQTPKSILIIGGGPIGLEFACLLQAAGSAVTVVEMLPTILPGEDPAVVSALTRSFENRGIVIKSQSTVKTLEKTAGGWKVNLQSGENIEVEQILCCVGRVSNPTSLQPEKAGIQVEKNQIKINENLQTTNPNVYAAGDVTTTRLAHAAAAQGNIAAANAWGDKKTFDPSFVPRCLYTWPEVASVGAWKSDLESLNLPVKAARAFYKGSAKALAANETEGFVQIISDPGSKKILGAQIIGANATELIHIFSVALKTNMTTDQLGEVIFAHPTLAEMVKEAAKK
ncbi:hypothetical protein BVX98_06885 [bacterium F11]|nr:hypothetical protein BVX98_06885 [bacterium F11]